MVERFFSTLLVWQRPTIYRPSPARADAICRGWLLLTQFRIHYMVLATKPGGTLMEAYCFKCRTKRQIKNPQSVTLKNGRPATQGSCPVCGTKVFRIGKA